MQESRKKRGGRSEKGERQRDREISPCFYCSQNLAFSRMAEVQTLNPSFVTLQFWGLGQLLPSLSTFLICEMVQG